MNISHKYLSRFIKVCIILFFSHFVTQANADDKKIIIKMATLAPEGSPWHEILKEMSAQWSDVSSGMVELRIYPGGTAGDEGAIVRKMRINQLQGAMITNSGLANISPAINALIIPMAADTYQKLDRMREKIGQELIDHYKDKGFVILNWGDAGWVRFFVSDQDPSVENVRKAKMFVWAGDDRIVEIWKNAGFNAVPLAATDMLPALQTGMVNAFPTTAIIALANQWFAFTPYMIDLPWAPLVGATVVSEGVWDQIPDSIKPKLLKIANTAGEKLQSQVRALENNAISEMKKRGMSVLNLTDKQRRDWRETIISVWPKMRGEVVPNKWFDAALDAVKDM